jgi:hypothetical protein
MNIGYQYTKEDYEALKMALLKSNAINYGRPDQFQYYQNELSKAVAIFLLKPYIESMKETEDDQ